MDTAERPEKFHHSLPVPIEKLAWVIGKNGSYLKQLQDKSGAVVTIAESVSTEYGRAWKYLSVYGTGRSVDITKKLLFIRLDRFPTRVPEDVCIDNAAVEADVDDEENYDDYFKSGSEDGELEREEEEDPHEGHAAEEDEEDKKPQKIGVS